MGEGEKAVVDWLGKDWDGAREGFKGDFDFLACIYFFWTWISYNTYTHTKVSVDRAVRDQVVVVAEAACKGLAELCERRQDEVDKVKNEVVELQNQLKEITSRTDTLMNQWLAIYTMIPDDDELFYIESSQPYKWISGHSQLIQNMERTKRKRNEKREREKRGKRNALHRTRRWIVRYIYKKPSSFCPANWLDCVLLSDIAKPPRGHEWQYIILYYKKLNY